MARSGRRSIAQPPARDRLRGMVVMSPPAPRAFSAPTVSRRRLQHSTHPAMRRRRQIVGWSLLGMAAMGAVSLLQTGVIRHLPDPPLPGFDSDRVNTSELAYALVIPDGVLSLLSLSLNLPLAALGPAERAQRHPWLPLLISAKAGAEALGAAWYFAQMPLRERAWCGYCIVGAVANWTVFALTLPGDSELVDSSQPEAVAAGPDGASRVLAIPLVLSQGDSVEWTVSFLVPPDVDAVTVSSAQLARDGVAAVTATVAILIAIGVNTVVKAALAAGVGGRALGKRMALVGALVIVAGGAGLAAGSALG